MTELVPPRSVPDTYSKYMGEAWMKAAFSKDPNTQVGAVIVGKNNYPLGAGYNGPPRKINDDSFSWIREGEFSKNDVITHAEINAIKRSLKTELPGSTLYVTAMPCPACMLRIVEEEISRVVFYNFQSSQNSSLRNDKWREKTLHIARLGQVILEPYEGNLNWIADWVLKLKEMNILI